MYAITQTRPNIAFAVQYFSKALQNPLLYHLNAVLNLLRYLNGTRNSTICYGAPLAKFFETSLQNSKFNLELNFDLDLKDSPLDHPLIPMGFSNSNFAGDKLTSKSTYGYLFIMAGGPIS